MCKFGLVLHTNAKLLPPLKIPHSDNAFIRYANARLISIATFEELPCFPTSSLQTEF